MLPVEFSDIENYDASANFNHVSCESHLSQLKVVMEILYKGEIKKVEKWAEKVCELQNMSL